MPSPSESEYSPSFGSFGNGSVASGRPSPSVSAEFGLVPRAYSWALVRPSPSGSAFASPALLGSRPCVTSHPSGRPSPSVSAFVMSVPCCCSSALVRPSPSQSAPPSDGSRGSEPSPATTEADIRTRTSATSTLMFFLFIFFLSPFFLKHRKPAVLSLRPAPRLTRTAASGCAGSRVAQNACAEGHFNLKGRTQVKAQRFAALRGCYVPIAPGLESCLCLPFCHFDSLFHSRNPMFPLNSTTS